MISKLFSHLRAITDEAREHFVSEVHVMVQFSHDEWDRLKSYIEPAADQHSALVEHVDAIGQIKAIVSSVPEIHDTVEADASEPATTQEAAVEVTVAPLPQGSTQ